VHIEVVNILRGLFYEMNCIAHVLQSFVLNARRHVDDTAKEIVPALLDIFPTRDEFDAKQQELVNIGLLALSSYPYLGKKEKQNQWLIEMVGDLRSHDWTAYQITRLRENLGKEQRVLYDSLIEEKKSDIELVSLCLRSLRQQAYGRKGEERRLCVSALRILSTVGGFWYFLSVLFRM